jgi:carbamate kinase
VGFGTPDQQRIIAANPDALLSRYGSEFAEGSMLPKVVAACDFARASGRPAMIGALADIEQLVAGEAGTRIAPDVDGVVTVSSTDEER